MCLHDKSVISLPSFPHSSAELEPTQCRRLTEETWLISFLIGYVSPMSSDAVYLGEQHNLNWTHPSRRRSLQNEY